MRPADLIRRGRDRNPRGVAIGSADGIRITHAELFDLVGARAATLQRIDPRPLSRVGICAGNSPGHIISLLAVLAAGKVWVPLNPKEPTESLRYKMELTQPSILILDEANLDRDLAGEATVLVDAVGQAGTLAAADANNAGRHPDLPASVGRESPQAIKFTGGSTGKPKGVVQPYRSWIAQAASQLHALALRSDDCFLVAAPVTHGTSCYLLPFLAAGGRLELPASSSPRDILAPFIAGTATSTFMPPTMIYKLLDSESFMPEDFPRLRHLIYGAAPMRAERIVETQRRFGMVVETTYGQTEASQIATFLSAAEMARPDLLSSVGREGLLSAVAIRDPSGLMLPRGELGEIVIGGDLLMSGYLNQPEATSAAIVDGWLRTGDAGVIDEHGYLHIRDRLKEVIITGGFNIYPADVESAIGQHGAVAECVAFGLPDDYWGERVEAAVELHEGSTASPDEIIGFAREKLGPVGTPKRLHVVTNLPRSPVGKVLRKEARTLFLDSSQQTKQGKPQ